MIRSIALPEKEAVRLGLSHNARIVGLDPHHELLMGYHREEVFRMGPQNPQETSLPGAADELGFEECTIRVVRTAHQDVER